MSKIELTKVNLLFKDSKNDCIKDWSSISKNIEIPSSTYVSNDLNHTDKKFMGLYKNSDGIYRTSGIVGVGWLKDCNGNTVIDSKTGNSYAILIKPRFEKLDPWEMLATVFADDEYEEYIDENGDFYTFNTNEKMIPIPATEKGGEFLAALSFLNACVKLCRRHLSKNITFEEINCNGKIMGNINVSKHIKYNLSVGREDRIYCRYPRFTLDTLENRIIKAALVKSHKIIQSNNNKSNQIHRMFTFCMNSLKTVNTVKIVKSDFLKISVSGCKSNYKTIIDLAETILFNEGIYDLFDKNIKESYRYVIPYTINMEHLFEFYVRTIIKNKFKEEYKSVYKLDKYRTKNKNPLKVFDSSLKQSVYLMNSYIPDIAIYRGNDDSKTYIAVFDVKYQHSNNKAYASSVRHNSHQLLFYALLLNVDLCGFIFPDELESKAITEGIPLNILDGNRIKTKEDKPIYYTQWLIDLSDELSKEESINSFYNSLIQK